MGKTRGDQGGRARAVTNCWIGWDRESRAEIVPECDAELGAGLVEAEEGIATVATDIAAGAAADLALGHLAADVVFRSIGMEGDLGAIERHQQLALVGMEPFEQTVEDDEAGATREDTVEPRP